MVCAIASDRKPMTKYFEPRGKNFNVRGDIYTYSQSIDKSALYPDLVLLSL
jgi:ABC-type lipoprotein release transport system permease subunit